MHKLKTGIGIDRGHERIGNADRNVEIVQPPGFGLGADELGNIGVVAAQHPHLRPAPRARTFHRGARLVEHMHIADRAGGRRIRALHPRALGADRAEIIADPAATAHGFRRHAQGMVNADLAIDRVGNTVAHRLHETVDQRDIGNIGARRRIDPPAGNEPRIQRRPEHRLPLRGVSFNRRQGPRHAAANRIDHCFAVQRLLGPLGIFLTQHIKRDRLPGFGSR